MSKPIHIAHLLPVLDQHLIGLLRSLSDDDWRRNTLAPQWTVKDITAHLLDGNLRALSMLRDGFYGETAGNIGSYRELVDFLNRLNADWVQAMRRVSPSLLIDLLVLTGAPYCNYLQSLDPFAPATFSVAWAGEAQSPNWFHTAREYTEKWHHQQQIRRAVGQERPLYSRELYPPYLDTSMRALPNHYRHVAGMAGECIRFHVDGEGGGDWFLVHDGTSWQLATDVAQEPDCTVSFPEDVAWRMFTKGISKTEAEKQSPVQGKEVLGKHVFGVLAVMG